MERPDYVRAKIGCMDGLARRRGYHAVLSNGWAESAPMGEWLMVCSQWVQHWSDMKDLSLGGE